MNPLLLLEGPTLMNIDQTKVDTLLQQKEKSDEDNEFLKRNPDTSDKKIKQEDVSETPEAFKKRKLDNNENVFTSNNIQGAGDLKNTEEIIMEQLLLEREQHSQLMKQFLLEREQHSKLMKQFVERRTGLCTEGSQVENHTSIDTATVGDQSSYRYV